MHGFFFLFWHVQKIRQAQMSKWIILIKCLERVHVMIGTLYLASMYTVKLDCKYSWWPSSLTAVHEAKLVSSNLIFKERKVQSKIRSNDLIYYKYLFGEKRCQFLCLSQMLHDLSKAQRAQLQLNTKHFPPWPITVKEQRNKSSPFLIWQYNTELGVNKDLRLGGLCPQTSRGRLGVRVSFESALTLKGPRCLSTIWRNNMESNKWAPKSWGDVWSISII